MVVISVAELVGDFGNRFGSAKDLKAPHAHRRRKTGVGERGIDARLFVAFDDDSAENILLARAQEGYDAHHSSGKWLVTKRRSAHSCGTCARNEVRPRKPSRACEIASSKSVGQESGDPIVSWL